MSIERGRALPVQADRRGFTRVHLWPRVQGAFESRDAAEERAQQPRVAGATADGARWRRAAEAEASARRLLQAAMEEFYGAAADASWLEAQGVAVADLLDDATPDASAASRGVGDAGQGGPEPDRGRDGGGDGCTVDSSPPVEEDGGDGDPGSGEDGVGGGAVSDGDDRLQGRTGGLLGRFFGM